MSPPSHFPPHPSLQPVTKPLFEFPESYSKFPLAICFTYGIVNFYVTLSIHLPFSLLSSPMSIDLFSTSVSPLLPWKYIHQCHLFRFHIYVSIQYLYFFFWLTSLCITSSRFVHLIMPVLFHYGLSQDIEYSSQCYIVGLSCFSIASANPRLPSNFSPTHHPAWQPQVCSLCLRLCFCLVDKFICVIFLISSYVYEEIASNMKLSYFLS